MTAEDAKILLQAIAGTEDFRPTLWERKLLRHLRADVRKGIQPSTNEGKKLEEIYRKSQWESFNVSVPAVRRPAPFYQYA